MQEYSINEYAYHLVHENDWMRPDALSLPQEQAAIRDVIVFQQAHVPDLPNFQVERVTMPSSIPGLPPREILHITPTLNPQTEEGLLYQQKIAEELVIHQQIWGINGKNKGT